MIETMLLILIKTPTKLSLYLTPKIPCVFLPNFVVFDIVGKINFSKNKRMRIEGSNRKILKLPC
jgi:hypothetical protein